MSILSAMLTYIYKLLYIMYSFSQCYIKYLLRTTARCATTHAVACIEEPNRELVSLLGTFEESISLNVYLARPRFLWIRVA